jgi:hypothetical protein
MPKSRKRRKKPQPQREATTRKIKLHPDALEAIKWQLEEFRRKFGREPGPTDPIFFDPDADEPQFMDADKMQAQIIEAMNKAGTPPEFAYAYRKTGLLYLGGDRSLWPKEHVEEWEAAVAEYRRLEQSSKEGGSH